MKKRKEKKDQRHNTRARLARAYGRDCGTSMPRLSESSDEEDDDENLVSLLLRKSRGGVPPDFICFLRVIMNATVFSVGKMTITRGMVFFLHGRKVRKQTTDFAPSLLISAPIVLYTHFRHVQILFLMPVYT